MRETLLRWAERVMRSREPDVVIGNYSDPYVLRWFIIPRNHIFCIYLHHFIKGDEDDALHDHVSDNFSIILETGYWEEFAWGWRLRLPGRVYFRLAGTGHRIHMCQSHGYEMGPHGKNTATTIFIKLPYRRNWGFHCPKGWIPWQKIVGTGHYGSRPGCAAFEAAAGAATVLSTAQVPAHGQTKPAP